MWNHILKGPKCSIIWYAIVVYCVLPSYAGLFTFFSYLPIGYGSTSFWKEEINLGGTWRGLEMIGGDLELFGAFGGVLKLRTFLECLGAFLEEWTNVKHHGRVLPHWRTHLVYVHSIWIHECRSIYILSVFGHFSAKELGFILLKFLEWFCINLECLGIDLIESYIL